MVEGNCTCTSLSEICLQEFLGTDDVHLGQIFEGLDGEKITDKCGQKCSAIVIPFEIHRKELFVFEILLFDVHTLKIHSSLKKKN